MECAREPPSANVEVTLYAPGNRVSKKVEHRAAAVALYFMFYNFGRMHQMLRVDPGDGSWRCESRLVSRGNRGAPNLKYEVTKCASFDVR